MRIPILAFLCFAALAALAPPHAAQTSQVVVLSSGSFAPDFNCCGAGNTLTLVNKIGRTVTISYNSGPPVNLMNNRSTAFAATAALNDSYRVIVQSSVFVGSEIANCKAGTSVSFNGSGVNPVGLTSVSKPKTGKPWSVSLSCAGANPSKLALFHIDFSGMPVVPTLGARGELLVNLASATCETFAIPHAGGTAVLGPMPIPIDPAFACLSYRVQGLCGDTPLGFLSNALDEVIGR